MESSVTVNTDASTANTTYDAYDANNNATGRVRASSAIVSFNNFISKKKASLASSIKTSIRGKFPMRSFLSSFEDSQTFASKMNVFNERKRRKQKKSSIFESILRDSIDSLKKNSQALLLWLLWLYIGTMFYAHMDFNGNYYKGFYYSVNAGYSIGWGVLHESKQASYWFSICYVIVGAVFLSSYIVSLIQSLFAQDDWQDRIHQNNLLKEQLKDMSTIRRVKLYLEYHTQKLLIIATWCLYIFFGTLISCHFIGWTVAEGIYFSVSSLSTGGLHGIPVQSPDSYYLWTGIFAATGIPIMGMAMGAIATAIVATRQEEYEDRIINSKLTKKEYDDLEVLQLFSYDEEKNLSMNREDFLLLSLIRLGKVDLSLLDKIFQKFDNLKCSKENIGNLTRERAKSHISSALLWEKNRADDYTTGTDEENSNASAIDYNMISGDINNHSRSMDRNDSYDTFYHTLEMDKAMEEERQHSHHHGSPLYIAARNPIIEGFDYEEGMHYNESINT